MVCEWLPAARENKKRRGGHIIKKVIKKKPSQSSHTPFLWDRSALDPQQQDLQPPLFRPKSRGGWISERASIGLLDFSAFWFLFVWVEDGVDMSQPLSNQRLSPPTFVALKLGLMFRQDILSGMALTFGIIVQRYSTVVVLVMAEKQRTDYCFANYPCR